MSNDTTCYTIATNHDIPKARILSESIKGIYPDWNVCVVFIESPDNCYANGDEDFTIIKHNELGIEQLESWLFMHNEEEAKRAFKVLALSYIMEILKSKKIIFLDLLSANASLLKKIETSLNQYSICLVPKITKPATEKSSVIEQEIRLLREGSFDLSIFGIKNNEQGKRFAEWWKQRINVHCYQNDERGIYFEQKWCNLVPVIFDNVCIIQNITGFIQPDEINLSENTPKKWSYESFSNGKMITDEMRWIYRRRKDLQKKYPFPFTVNHGEQNLLTFFTWCDKHQKSSQQE